ncbi:bifunctional uridylate/adenylate kinase [Scheffersomyces spartinae]|uniref:Uridylate kinase n=1 Tax=Scheffersomyces spartinae TaxID=45513 RepID=A0A9P7V824_9ASCO|nr:bifunctional uridylate/adenylate kinase [Scheffersomyces spartinae]KAG7193105.1 bifunctional uridylate/adenylate kinase [Scheffersomyces spartinae]
MLARVLPSLNKPLVGGRRLLTARPFVRFNTTTPPRTPSPPPVPTPPRRKGNGWIVGAFLLAGLGFAGTFVYALTPKEKSGGPAFSDGKVSVVFVLGGPGSGKGTQCSRLVKDHGFVHLSAGDLLRAEQSRKGSRYGELIATHIREGTIVPQEVTIALLEQAIKENFEKGSTKFLVDGFPRKMDQAITFEDSVAKSSFTLFFECPEATMLERLMERGKTSGRTDDNIESIKKRFRTFVDTSMPVVEYFDKQGKVVKVSCNNTVDQVYSDVEKALKTRGI